MQQVILNYKDVDIYQGEHLVLGKVNFRVEEGEMVYLTGPVGSGKSSLLKSIYGEVSVEGSKADVLGFNMLRLKTKHQPALRRQMGIVFQDFQLLPDRTVHRNLDFVLRSTGWKRKEDREKRIVEVLEMVKLGDKKDKFIFELSGGEQQRICIARAILNNPKVILADEPTGNLDPETTNDIMKLLMKIRDNGTTILMATHNYNLILKYPSRVISCANGTITESAK